MTNHSPFKRLNFYSGMFTTAQDWKDGEAYHIEKLKLHHQGLHKPGVVFGLNVTPGVSSNGGLNLDVSPGSAIDGYGNTISLALNRSIKLETPKDSAKRLFIQIRFHEKLSNFVVNDTQIDYSGATRYAEDPIVEVSDHQPDNIACIELARIELTPGAIAVYPYREGETPGDNQIDRSQVQWSLSTEELETRHEQLKANHGAHLNQLDSQVNALDTRLATEEATSSAHEGRLADLDACVGDHEARLAQEETTSSDHGQRLNGLDEQTARHDARLTQSEAGIAALLAATALHGVRLEQHDTLLGEQDARLTAQEAGSAQLDARLAEEEMRSKEFQQRLDSLEQRCDDLEGNLSVLTDYSRLHYRGSHTFGVVPQEGEQLQVRAAGGLNVRVLTGAALDRQGNPLIVAQERTLTVDPGKLHLPQVVFIALRQIPDKPRSAALRVLADLPADESWVELARIDLQPGVTEISNPLDPANPGGNQIDRRSAPVSGAIAVRAQGMSAAMVQRIVQIMGRSRRSFADLDMEFPTPSVGDVRTVCLTVETMARVGRLHLDQLADLMTTVATIEQDVSRELDKKYGKVLATTVEFEVYVRAVRGLHAALRMHDADAILTAQEDVATAAYNLSQVPIEAPTADAGRDQELATYDDRHIVTLNGSASQARGGRIIKRYLWTVSAS